MIRVGSLEDQARAAVAGQRRRQLVAAQPSTRELQRRLAVKRELALLPKVGERA